MKTIHLLLILLLFSCGSRTAVKRTEISKENIEVTAKTNLSHNIESTTNSESTFDFSNFLDNQNISIQGDGNPFTLNYNGLVYSGSSAVEISNKKEQTKLNIINKIETTYKTETKYQTETTYKSITYKKNKDTERKAMPFYFWIAIGFFLKIIIGFAWNSFKKSNVFTRITKL